MATNIRYAKVEGGKVTDMIMSDGASFMPDGTWILVEDSDGNKYMKANEAGTTVDHGVVGSNWDGSTMALDSDIITKAEAQTKLDLGFDESDISDADKVAGNFAAREANLAAIRTAFAGLNIDFDELLCALDDAWTPRDKTHTDGDLIKALTASGHL